MYFAQQIWTRKYIKTGNMPLFSSDLDSTTLWEKNSPNTLLRGETCVLKFLLALTNFLSKIYKSDIRLWSYLSHPREFMKLAGFKLWRKTILEFEHSRQPACRSNIKFLISRAFYLPGIPSGCKKSNELVYRN